MSANGPRKFEPNCSSKPSLVVIRVGGCITPALFTSRSSCDSSAASFSANSWTDVQVGEVDPADLELGVGVLGQDLGLGGFTLGRGPDRHHHPRAGGGQALGGLLAGAAVGAGDDDELAALVGDVVHIRSS